ncbi:MAG: ribosome-associated translation inhibitor RaiA [Clostridiales bacterium]|jgi:putative sigma-54 modulation protein|nr:ribosome-associated translation inhibitor RaiA [Clostridiales bacterium]
MKYTFTGRNNFNITDELKERTQLKVGKLEKLLPEGAEAFVTYSVNKSHHRVEVTIPLKKRILRAEVTSNDMYSALDDIIDVLEKQMIKYKNRLRDRSRRDASYTEELGAYGNGSDAYEESVIVIDRNKHFSLKPMDAEEAVMEMEMLGHSFYVFRNGATDLVNVVYKRENGTYGLIEPEY